MKWQIHENQITFEYIIWEPGASETELKCYFNVYAIWIAVPLKINSDAIRIKRFASISACYALILERKVHKVEMIMSL